MFSFRNKVILYFILGLKRAQAVFFFLFKKMSANNIILKINQVKMISCAERNNFKTLKFLLNEP